MVSLGMGEGFTCQNRFFSQHFRDVVLTCGHVEPWECWVNIWYIGICVCVYIYILYTRVCVCVRCVVGPCVVKGMSCSAFHPKQAKSLLLRLLRAIGKVSPSCSSVLTPRYMRLWLGHERVRVQEWLVAQLSHWATRKKQPMSGYIP